MFNFLKMRQVKEIKTTVHKGKEDERNHKRTKEKIQKNSGKKGN